MEEKEEEEEGEGTQGRHRKKNYFLMHESFREAWAFGLAVLRTQQPLAYLQGFTRGSSSN